MIDLNYVAILVAAVAAFVAAFVYYMVFGKQLSELSSAAAGTERTPAWVMPIELVRNLVVAAVVAGLAANLEIAAWIGAVLLGLALWIGFPAVLLSGSVIHEKVPWKVAAIHAGDWLVKLFLIAVIVSVWH